MGNLLSCLQQAAEAIAESSSRPPGASNDASSSPTATAPSPQHAAAHGGPVAQSGSGSGSAPHPHSQQQHVSIPATGIPNDAAIRAMSLSDAVQCCWRLDSNRLRPGADYKINVQQGKKPFWKEDKAPDPLFEYVSDAVWKSRPTYRALQHLLDHYHAETGRAEHMNDRWRSDMDAFVDAITETAVMQFCHRYCVVHRGGQNVPNDTAGFQKLLKTVWLELYNRTKGGPKDSSGFEHVFCGEVRDGKISGFHNWVRFYLEERKGTSVLDYRGYIKPKSHGDAPSDSDDHVLTLQFVHNGATKELGTMFIGTSPEFEIAAYTICFLCGASNSGTNGSNLIRLNTGTDVFELEIVCHKIHGNRVGSCYPYVKSHHEA